MASRLTKGFPSANGGEIDVSLTTVNRSLNTTLKIHGPALIQPAKTLELEAGLE